MLCKICKSPIAEEIVLKNSKKYFYCAHCDFISLDESFYISPEAEKARYDQHQNSIEDLGYVDMLRDFIDFAIKPYAQTEILDYGSGPEPVLAELLKQDGYKVDIYDPFYAPTKLEKSFDLISSTEVFEHMHNPLAEFEKIVQLIKPNGYLSIMTNFIPKLEDFPAWFYKNDSTHVCFFSVRTFEFISSKVNFKLKKHDSTKTIVLQS